MLAQQLLNGLVVGGVYALFALGFTLVFGIHHLMNLAHGAVFMTGAFVGTSQRAGGFPTLDERVAGDRGVRTAVGADEDHRVSAPAQVGRGGVWRHHFNAGRRPHHHDLCPENFSLRGAAFPVRAFPVQIFQFFGLRVSLLQLFMSVSAFVLMLVLFWYLYRTPLGTRVRSVSGDERAAVLSGVNPNVVYFQTFFLSGALAGASGVLIGLAFNSIQFTMGEPFCCAASWSLCSAAWAASPAP